MKTLKKILLVFLLATSVSEYCLSNPKEEVNLPEAPETIELPEEPVPEEFDAERACLLFKAELARINAEIPHLEGQEKEDAIKRAVAIQTLITTIKDSSTYASELQENTPVWEERLSNIKKASWIAAGIGGGILLIAALISGVLLINSVTILKLLIARRDANKLRIEEVEDPYDPNPAVDRLVESFGIKSQPQVQNPNVVPEQPQNEKGQYNDDFDIQIEELNFDPPPEGVIVEIIPHIDPVEK